MHFPLTRLLFVGLCLIPCSWSYALQNTPIVVSTILPAPTGDAELYYNPITGELIVATNGVAAVVITAQSDNAYDLSTVDVEFGAFDVPGFETIMLLNAEGFQDNQLVAIGLNPALPTGVHNLGAVLLPGAFTPQDFITAFGDVRLDRIVLGQPALQPSGVVRILIPGPIDPIEVAISQGEIQRSMLTGIDVTFPGDVQIGAGAFSLVNREDNSIVPNVSVEEEPGTDPTVATLTFSGPGVDQLSRSLDDGNYVLTINGDLITNDQGIAFDADEDGTPGGVLVIGDQEEDGLYRLFADADGDRDVDNADLGQLIGTFFAVDGSPNFNDIFDFDADGDVDNADLGPFIANFFQTLPF